MTQTKNHILLFLFLLLPFEVFSQVSFVAHAPQTVSGRDRFYVKFVLQNAQGERFTPPTLRDFDVLSGPSVSQSKSVQIINGNTSSSYSEEYTFLLSPKRSGLIRLGAASIVVNGKTLRTRPLDIRVEKHAAASSQSPQEEEDEEDIFRKSPSSVSAIGSRDLYFTASASKRKVYEQEPVMLTYKFHARVGVALANVMLVQKPDLKGFWTQEVELPRNLSSTSEKINGHLYRVGTNLQYLIFPQQVGKLSIPGVTFDCEVLRRTEPVDEIEAFFNGSGNLNLRLQRRTEDLEIEVLPLPTPRPTNFSGGVGRMSVSGKLVSNVPKTNDIATYRLTVKGTGNLKLIQTPRVFFPKGMDSYAPKVNDHTAIGSEGVSGEIQFDYTFVPRKVGKYTLPPVEFVYFDTAARKYVTLHTAPLTIHVEKGLRPDADVEAELFLRNADIRDIKLGKNRAFSSDRRLWPGTFLYFAALLLLLMGTFAMLKYLPRLIRRYSDKEERLVQKAASTAGKRLRWVKKKMPDSDNDAFFAAISEAVNGYLADKLRLEIAALTRQRITEALRQRGVDERESERVESLLNDIDFGRFAPGGDAELRENLFVRATEIINSLERQLG